MDDAAPWVPRLTDGVVLLNGHRPSDVDAHLAGEDEDTAWWFGWWPATSTEHSAREAFLHWQQQWRDQGSTRTFAARRLDTGQLAGGCQLRLRDDGVGLVSYWTSAQHRGRGYASRALGLLCQYARDSLGVTALEAHVALGNAASLRVARRAGFTHAGDYVANDTPMRCLVATSA